MEVLTRILVAPEFVSPLSFWLASAIGLLVIFVPVSRKKRGLAIDLTYWKNQVGFKAKRVPILRILLTITTVLIAVGLAKPQSTVKSDVRIYGKPVMLVVDVSGSMSFGEATGGGTPLSSYDKALEIFNDLVGRNFGADLGLVIYSTENYVARYFTSNPGLLKDTLENRDEIYYISTGTRTAEALAKARRFLMEQSEANDRALALITDLDTDLSEAAATSQEIMRSVESGIRVYVIVIERDKSVNSAPIVSQAQGLKIVSMNDQHGIDQICAEMAAMAASPLKGEETVTKTSLAPLLMVPLLGLVLLCLVLSETRFRKIP